MHIKLKKGRVERLVKEIFGKNIDITECTDNLFVREKSNLRDFLKMSARPSFLNIFLSIDKNKFELKDAKYYDKTYEFAEKYEANFGGEVKIRTDYSKERN